MNLFSDWLALLQVPHTACYSQAQYGAMPFKTLFGVSKLMGSYGVATRGLHLPSALALEQLPVPFVACTRVGMVIVTAVTPSSICYLTQDVKETIPREKFNAAFTGDVLLASPSPDAAEPDYKSHRITEIVTHLRDVALVACAAFLFIYLFISNGIYRSWAQILVMAFDCVGLYMSWLLMRKSLNIKSKAADRVCRVLQEGGCDHILKTSASKLFGVFKWSEVGLGYFSVSLGALLIFPEQAMGSLCLLNACCLPYTLWSIWYQHFRAKAWCTLCVSVQATLWCLFICYLTGGLWHSVLPIGWPLFVLLGSYILAVTLLNKLSPYFHREL